MPTQSIRNTVPKPRKIDAMDAMKSSLARLRVFLFDVTWKVSSFVHKVPQSERCCAIVRWHQTNLEYEEPRCEE